ncbi:MAG: hypothetical protein K2H53_05020 [Clostridia bacterium]|nr:hypothetical protein [Clostridia bacterium]
MSRRKRAIEKAKKQNSEAQKRKRAKKAKYASHESSLKWDEKKERRRQSNLNKRVSRGISVECPLEHYEKPSAEKCYKCTRKCSYKSQ